MSGCFAVAHAPIGRRSIAPEELLRALLLLAHYPGCASIIVGINSVEQADALASTVENVAPDMDLVRQVEAFWRERVAR